MFEKLNAMSRLQRNIFANYVGQCWMAALSILLVPVYLGFLGVEAYGLIGFFTMLQNFSSMFDMGLSATINREVARQSSLDQHHHIRSLVRTFEYVYWGIGLILSISIILASGWIARKWLNANSLPAETIRLSILIFGFTMAVRWPISLYRGALQGIEKQVLLNVISVIITTLRSLGAVVVLYFIPSLSAFLIWQLALQFVEIITSVTITWLLLKDPEHSSLPLFDLKKLQGNWRFAVNMSGITIIGAILTQIDKIVVSKFFSLEEFGYYTVAGTIASGLFLLINPVFNAIFPRFSALFAKDLNSDIRSLYHSATRLIVFIVTPIVSALAFFSYDILLLWSHSVAVASHVQIPLTILIIGTLLNSVLNIPHALTLASGKVWIALLVQIASLLVFVPLTVFMTKIYGLNGAPLSWVILNASTYFIMPILIDRYLIHGEAWTWFFKDTLPFFLVISLFFYCCKQLSVVYSEAVPSPIFLMTGCMLYCTSILGFFRKNLQQLEQGQASLSEG